MCIPSLLLLSIQDFEQSHFSHGAAQEHAGQGEQPGLEYINIHILMYIFTCGVKQLSPYLSLHPDTNLQGLSLCLHHGIAQPHCFAVYLVMQFPIRLSYATAINIGPGCYKHLQLLLVLALP